MNIYSLLSKHADAYANLKEALAFFLRSVFFVTAVSGRPSKRRRETTAQQWALMAGAKTNSC
jgi:hypothetical protein